MEETKQTTEFLIPIDLEDNVPMRVSSMFKYLTVLLSEFTLIIDLTQFAINWLELAALENKLHINK